MNDLKIYRKRMIPDECILLKDDVILDRTDEHIITSWKTLKPRRDFSYGFSCYFLERGYKVSRFCREDGSLLYWYCDIVDYLYDGAQHSLIVTDLLADVIVYPDGISKVLDVDELADALENKLCDPQLIAKGLRTLGRLLDLIYADRFDTLISELQKWAQ